MLDLFTMLNRLRRPRLLTKAARFGLDDYRRDRDLPRLLHTDDAPRNADALMRLLSLEHECEQARRANAAEYLYARHIDVLIALMAEARILKETARPRALT